MFNTYALIQDPYYTGQQGIIGHLLGGSSSAPIVAIGSGQPLACGTYTNAQSFGAGDGANFFDTENCVLTKAYNTQASLHSNATAGAGAFDIFANPSAVLSTLRPAILDLDTGTGGIGVFTGLMYWNVDLRVVKTIHIFESVSTQFEYTVTNVFNHPVFADPFAGNTFTGNGVDPPLRQPSVL